MANPLIGFAWSKWLYGLWAAVIGGGATAVNGALSLIIVDPKDFNIQTGRLYQVAGVMFTFGALTHFFAYLKDHPAPEILSSERTSQSVQVTQIQGTGDGTATKTVTTNTKEKVAISKDGHE